MWGKHGFYLETSEIMNHAFLGDKVQKYQWSWWGWLLHMRERESRGIAGRAEERAWPTGYCRLGKLAGPAESYKVVGMTEENW